MLICTNCGRRYPLKSTHQRCPICNEPLELNLQMGKIRDGRNVWERFEDFYSYFHLNMEFSLGEGDTPFLYSESLSKELKNEIYFKNEATNPTWSFKDRGTFIALNHAVAIGMNKIGVVSTGNMAASVAAYGARAGLDTYVFVSSKIPPEKISQISIYNPTLFVVNGDYGDLYYESLEIGMEMGIYFMNSDNPFRIEGYKSIAYEIQENIEPDYVVVPTSSGGLFRGIFKGFRELYESGYSDKLPRMIAVQASGCAPICDAYEKGYDIIHRIENPYTVAHAIENPYPPSGNEVLRILKRYGGKCIRVTDEEIRRSQKNIAKEGIFIQPASATTLAALKKLNIMDKRIVLILTGSGLKTGYDGGNGNIFHCSIENLKNFMEERI